MQLLVGRSAGLPERRRLQHGAADHGLRLRRHDAARRVPAGEPRAGRARSDQRVRTEGHRCHRGRALLHPRRRRLPRRGPRTREQPHGRRAGGRFHHHPAVRAQHHPVRRDARHLLQAQDPRDVHLPEAGGAVLQRRDPAHVLEHHQLRLGRLRHRGCLRALLLQGRQGSHAERGGHARGHSRSRPPTTTPSTTRTTA